MSLNSDFAQSTPNKILRDTGASQSLIMADILPFSKKTYSGTSVLIHGVECGFINVPRHNIYLSSDLVTGLWLYVLDLYLLRCLLAFRQ